MAMLPCGTFDYVVQVPAHDEHADRAWPGRVREPVPIHGRSVTDNRLVGLTPMLSISDGDSTLDRWPADVPIPDTPQSKITLTAPNRERSQVRSASFQVATELLRRVLAGDTIEVYRTLSGGLGFAVLRNDELVVAAGAVAGMALGKDIHLAVMWPEPMGYIAITEPPAEFPVKVSIAGESRTLSRGSFQLGGYELFLAHGVVWTVPTTDECVAVSRTRDVSSGPAIETALMLREGKLEMVKW